MGHDHDHPHAHDDHHHAHGEHHHAHDDHPHAHHHPHTHDESPQATAPRGVGAGKILFLDAPSGLAGDMIVAALADLGVPRTAIEENLAKLPIGGYHVHFGTRTQHAIVATSFDVHVDEKQPERTYKEVRGIFEKANLPEGVLSRALRVLHRLAEAEAKIHRTSLDDVHLHEVGGVDAMVDIVAAATAIDFIGATLVVSPLPMGRGFVRAAHGMLPLPAPATIECLKGFETYDGRLSFEFVTPTGAAIVGALCESSERWPTMAPVRVGWGAGTATLPDRPNVLRAILADRGAAPTVDHGTHVVIEANIDDMTGELAGHALARLLEEGALDAWTTANTMKKGRPGLTLSALATKANEHRVTETFLRETTTIGVRSVEVSRTVMARRIETVHTAFGGIPVKVSVGPAGAPHAKPEFDACAALAREHGVPVRDVIHAALVACSPGSSHA